MPRWTNVISFGNLISVGTVLLACAGFYFTTNATLANQDKDITEIKLSISTLIKERDKLRLEITDRSEKTANGIGELSRQVAVQGVQITAVKDELVKLNQVLSTSQSLQRTR